MKLTNLRLLALATAALALNACSSEPSDWRPENKVSLDMVAPGTRETDNFDQNTEYAPSQSKGGAITKPMSTTLELQGTQGSHGVHSAEAALTANSEEGMRKRGKLNDAGKSSQSDTTASGHEVQR
jgi:hypothetical protein